MTKSHDIVDRLRLFGSSAVEREAANEIERLRDELARNADEFRETITELRQRVETLTSERDEARRDVCYLRPCVCLGLKTADEYAQFRGWDCFKEDKP